MDNQITFNGYPVTFEVTDKDVLISCKGVTGTLAQMDIFFKRKTNRVARFGDSKIRLWNKGMAKVDCLEDTMEQAKIIYEFAKNLKNGTKENSQD